MRSSNGRAMGDGHVAFADVCNLESIFRNKALVALVFLIFIAGTMSILWLRDRSYESDSRLFVRETVTVDPTASTAGGNVTASDSQQREIQSVLDILTSRGLIADVVDELGPTHILDYRREEADGESESSVLPNLDIGQAVARLKVALAPLKLTDPPNERAKAIEVLSKSIQVAAEDESNVVTVTVEGRSPFEAQETCEVLLKTFLKTHLDAHRVPGALEFFESQTAAVKSDLDAATSQLRDLKNDCALTSVDASRTVLNEKLREVELEFLLASTTKFASEAKRQSMMSTLADVPETVIIEELTGLVNTAKDTMRGQLFGVELQKADLATFTPNHPEVRRQRRKLDEAKSVFGGQSVAPQLKRSINETHQQLDLARMLEQAETVAQTARLEKLSELRTSILREMRQLNEREIAITDVERTVELLDAKYRRYVASQENARIESALQEQQLSSINIVQPPTFNDDPVDFGNSFLFVLGTLGALVGSVFSAFGLEYLRNDISSESDVERELGLPVLATIPAAKRQRIVLN